MKILYVTTISNTINAFLLPHIQALLSRGHEVELACNIKQELTLELRQLGCKVHKVDFERTPFSFNNVKAYKSLKKIIEINGYDYVHTHTPIASAIVRIIAKKIPELKVIYTAHGYHFFKGSPVANWLFYFPIEKWLSNYTDSLITINDEDYKISNRFFSANNVVKMSGVGIDLHSLKTNEVICDKRKELGIADEDYLIISVGELNNNKNHETVLRALSMLTDFNYKYVICGEGPLNKKLENLIVKLGISEKVKLVGYRKDVIEILRVSNLFVFPSKREGLPVSLIEAMALGVPIICSNTRGNRDLIQNEYNGLIVEPDDVIGFKNAIVKMKNSENLALQFTNVNLVEVSKYSINQVQKELIEVYGFSEGVK